MFCEYGEVYDYKLDYMKSRDLVWSVLREESLCVFSRECVSCNKLVKGNKPVKGDNSTIARERCLAGEHGPLPLRLHEFGVCGCQGWCDMLSPDKTRLLYQDG